MPVETDLRQDPAILRHLEPVSKSLRAFRPDLVHVTSMGDFGLLGWWLARDLRLPMVAAWHTNVHEYAAWRFERGASFVPARLRAPLAARIERLALGASMRFYRRGAVSLAPNAELVDLLRAGTDRPVFLMERGVDTALFDPAKRLRDGSRTVLGYVGRLSSEKNLRVFRRVEEALRAEGLRDYLFEIVGHGAEKEWLRRNLLQARFRGVLAGEPLARAYAGMDVFLFPSRTDTYGNAVWEAKASGVPAVVTNSGGPQHFVRDGETGLVSRTDAEFARNVIALCRDTSRRRRMGRAARSAATRQSWDAIFERLYAEAYASAVSRSPRTRRGRPPPWSRASRPA